MTDTASPGDVLAGFELPEHWSEAARETFREVLTQRPDLSGGALGALEQACELISTADALDVVARAAGHVTEGSKGQTVLHPAVAESRQARSSASQVLRALAPPPTSGNLSNSQRAVAAARSRWST